MKLLIIQLDTIILHVYALLDVHLPLLLHYFLKSFSLLRKAIVSVFGNGHLTKPLEAPSGRN